MNDGRLIDTSVATLEGEGAQQRTSPARNFPAGEFHTDQPPSTELSYYNRPVIKPPVWIAAVPTYFFVGGVAGAAMTMGMAVQLFGGPALYGFARRCHWTGAIGGSLGSALLIMDLGRKERFLNMLRVFRPTSPMSVGSWVLAMATPCSLTSALFANPLGEAASIGAGILGLPLAIYTAVLMSNSAVPIWLASRRSLPFLFCASSISSMASVFDLMALRDREQAIIRRFGTVGRAADLIASAVVERDASEVPRVGLPLRGNVAGTIWNAARILTGASLVISLLPGKSRGKRALSGVLGILGGACVRFAIFEAGKASALDPHATFQQQSRLQG
jgi:formate-dependent nitrite reductase membrane component NrfD